MKQDTERLLRELPAADLDRVAQGALADPAAVTTGDVDFAELHTPHFDARTAGIVRVTGFARRAGGSVRPWSAVAKIIDLAIPANGNVFVAPENEEIVYERGLFAADGLPFRPARCFLVSRPSPLVKVLWLEDLTGAAGAPFGVDQLLPMARAIGAWNGFHLRHAVDPGFAMPTNNFVRRWQTAGFDRMLAALEENATHPYAKEAYGNLPIGVAAELRAAITALNERTARQAPSLAFGDCNAGNLFWTGTEVVAVDWASLSLDPPGVDAGCAIGSSVTTRLGAEIAAAERSMFAAYVVGLRSQNWRGDLSDVRRAYLGLFSIYLMYSALTPGLLAEPGRFFQREFMEKRYQTRWEDIARLKRGVVSLIPSFIAEIRTLTDAA